jgi:hypothetical protein
MGVARLIVPIAIGTGPGFALQVLAPVLADGFYPGIIHRGCGLYAAILNAGN